MKTRITRMFWMGALVTALLLAQATDSTLVGTVVDSTGAAVPGATVTAVNQATDVKYTTQTTSAGEFRLNNIPVGRYNVSAAASGFAKATVSNVDTELNRTQTVNLALPVGTVSTTIEVTESAAPIDTSSAQLQTAFDTRQVTDVPTAGFSSHIVGTSGIYNLSLLGAGVATSGGVGMGVGPSVSGQRPENNSFNIDGVNNDDRYGTGPAINVSNEAISELSMLQNHFSAEFGGASGGVFNAIVKSGTNSLHGSVYEYFQNRDLNALDAVNVFNGQTSLPRYDANRLGANVGGPIIRNKLFYFGDYEYNPTGFAAQPGQTVAAPTSAGITMLNSISGLSAANLGVFEKYVPVAPTADGTTKVKGQAIPIGPLSFASPSFNNAYTAVIAIDWNVSDKDQVRGRYFYSNSTGIDFAAAIPTFYQSSPSIANAGTISEFHNFSPTLENEMRVSFRRFTNVTPAGNFAFPGLGVFPNLAFDDLNLQLGPDPNAPGGEKANNLQIQENLTKTWGRHTFKAGYSFADIILSGYFIQRSRGDYDYVNLEQYLVDMSPTGGNLSGVAGERSVGTAGASLYFPFGFLQNSAFFNDDFRVRPNLTLNLGIRYEYVTEPLASRAQGLSNNLSVPGLITFNTPHFSPNDWSPRIGFAYSPGNSGVWSIRGGVSRSFDLTYINLNQNAAPPYYQTTVDVDPNNSTPNFLAQGGLTAPSPGRGAVASYTWSNQRPYALTGTIGVQRLLKRNYTIEARYVYTKGVHLWNQTRLNRVSPVTAENFIPTFLSTPDAATLAGLKTNLGDLLALPNNYMAPFGFTKNIVGYHPWGNSRYNGLQLQLNKRYSKNLSYIVAYTWSHNFDDSTATNFSTILSPRRAQDFQNMRAEWASSALDRRQRLTITPIYDFKPFQNGNWFLKNIAGNWTISGTYTYQSPEFATIQSGVDSNLNGDSAGDRAIINPAGAANAGSGVNALNAAGQVVGDGGAGDPSTVAYVAQNPNARYIVAGLGARANSGRNTFPLGHTNNFDASLTKRINITERFRFDLSAQAFNLFNHPQFIGGYTNDVEVFGTNAISRAFLTPGNSAFGQYNQATPNIGFFPSNARAMQLVARFVF